MMMMRRRRRRMLLIITHQIRYFINFSSSSSFFLYVLMVIKLLGTQNKHTTYCKSVGNSDPLKSNFGRANEFNAETFK